MKLRHLKRRKPRRVWHLNPWRSVGYYRGRETLVTTGSIGRIESFAFYESPML